MKDMLMDTYKRTGLVFAKGSGSTLEAEDGKEYLDFASGIGVNSLGHAHPRLAAAIADQAARLIHVSNYYQSREALELSPRSSARAPAWTRSSSATPAPRPTRGRSRSRGSSASSKDPARTIDRDPARLLPRPHHHHSGRHGPGQVPRAVRPLSRWLRPCRARGRRRPRRRPRRLDLRPHPRAHPGRRAESCPSATTT